MQQPYVLLCCYANRQYLWYKPQQVHIVSSESEYSNLHNMKFKYYATQNFGSPIDVHRIDASWGEGRLLLDPGSCRLWIPNSSLPCSPIRWHALVMQNTTIVWLSINLMWDLSSKVFARKKESIFTGFTLFSQTHTSIDMQSSCTIPLLCDCLSIWCAIWATKCLQIEHWRVLLFPRKHINQILTHPSTCYSHAEYYYCVTVYRSDVQFELQSDYNFDT